MRAARTDLSVLTPDQLAAHYAAVNKRKSAKYYAKHKEEIRERRAGNRSEERIKYIQKYGDAISVRYEKWRIENRTKDLENKKRYYQENKDAFIKKAREWQKRNPEKMAVLRYVQCAKRNATIFAATPKWANLFFMKEAYHLAKIRNLTTGVKWHVDHRIPIRSPLVCGLHVEHNLEVIPAVANRAKSNKYWPDMPEKESL